MLGETAVILCCCENLCFYKGITKHLIKYIQNLEIIKLIVNNYIVYLIIVNDFESIFNIFLFYYYPQNKNVTKFAFDINYTKQLEQNFCHLSDTFLYLMNHKLSER